MELHINAGLRLWVELKRKCKTVLNVSFSHFFSAQSKLNLCFFFENNRMFSSCGLNFWIGTLYTHVLFFVLLCQYLV